MLIYIGLIGIGLLAYQALRPVVTQIQRQNERRRTTFHRRLEIGMSDMIASEREAEREQGTGHDE